MIGPPRTAARGFTLIELALAMAVAATAFSALVALFGVTRRLSDESRLATRTESEHRANLVAVAALLRDADPASLTGFDESGVASRPGFQRFDGLVGADVTRTAALELAWEPYPDGGRDDRGVRLGQVVLRRDGSVERVLARRVPEGGFGVTRSGRTLAVRVETFHASREAHLTGRTVDTFEVCLRN